MAKVEHRKARKDYPDNGIKKGDMYYFAKIKTGPYSSRTIRQIGPISRSQLTSSEYLSELYGWEDAKNEVSEVDELESLIEQIRAIGESRQEKFDNMPDGLQQGDTGQLLEDRVNACESAADELESIKNEWENAEPEDCTTCDGSGTDDKGDPCEDCDGEGNTPVDNDEFISRVHDVSVDA